MDVVHYDKPPVSPEDMDKIEARHAKEDAAPRVLGTVQVCNTVEHHDRGLLLKQLDYTAAVIVDLQLKLADLKENLK